MPQDNDELKVYHCGIHITRSFYLHTQVNSLVRTRSRRYQSQRSAAATLRTAVNNCTKRYLETAENGDLGLTKLVTVDDMGISINYHLHRDELF